MKFSRAFDQTLNEFGISAKWLAERTGVSQPTISNFRHNQQSTRSEILERLIEVLPEEAQDFFFNQMRPKPPEESIGSLGRLNSESMAQLLHEAANWVQMGVRRYPVPRDQIESLLYNVLEISLDGILVLKQDEILYYNSQFLKIWNPPEDILTTRDDRLLMGYQQTLVTDPQKFVEDIEREYHQPYLHQETLVCLSDGRRFIRISKPHYFDDEIVGRIIAYHP